jgi:hypothetical protein
LQKFLDGQSSAWSKGYTFLVIAPPAPRVVFPVIPANAWLTESPPVIGWSASPGAAGYELQVMDDTAGATIIEQPFLTDTSFPLSSPLAKGHRYTARVRAFNAANQVGDWSAPDTFRVGSPK